MTHVINEHNWQKPGRKSGHKEVTDIVILIPNAVEICPYKSGAELPILTQLLAQARENANETG